MSDDALNKLLLESGALMKGHFVLSSSRHSDTYFEKFRALEQPRLAAEIGERLAGRFVDAEVDVVLAPAVGAIVLGFSTALALGVRSIFAEREDGAMSLRRGFEIGPQEKVLVVEDVITTGKSVKEVLDLVPSSALVGVGCLVDRSGGAELGTRVETLLTIQADSWPADSCPLCAEGIALTTRGSRFLANS